MRCVLVLAGTLGYLSYVFRLFTPYPWTHGLGDWQDPYFINALLEHWHRSVMTLSSPASPPMYFPAAGTLGYSHGLVLFAPFYIPLRLFLHPFHADTFALLAVMLTGTLCLYALCRRAGVSAMEAIVVTALFASSRNVVHGETGVWAQRASVFVIPAILLLLVTSWRMRGEASRLALAACGGLLAMLLYVQDFYTAHFAMLFAALFGAARLSAGREPWRQAAASWSRQPSPARTAMAGIAIACAWAAFVWITGGVDLLVLGVRLRSHDWRRPLLLAVGAAAVLTIWRMRRGPRTLSTDARWWLAAALGATLGAGVFLWIFLPTYQEHPAFPREHLLSSLVSDRLLAYHSMRTFVLVFVVGVLGWLPLAGAHHRTRLYCAWLVVGSVLVALVPLNLPGFSAWMTFVHWLPGFGVIRDPKRIVQVYELAAVVAIALLLPCFPARPRLAIAGAALALLVLVPNPERFDYERRIDVFNRWVAAPIVIEPGCRSFFMKPGPAEYMARSPQMWSLYGVDATFVALNESIPSLNGYSAWFPDGWALHDPQLPAYLPNVRAWIAARQLDGVCAFDIETRRMTPLDSR